MATAPLLAARVTRRFLPKATSIHWMESRLKGFPGPCPHSVARSSLIWHHTPLAQSEYHICAAHTILLP